MPPSRTVNLPLLRLTAVLGTLAALMAATVPPSVAQDPGEDFPPIVSNGVVNPSSLPYLGGTVTISATVTDDVSIVAVYADVVGSDGGSQSVQLSQTGETTYSGTVAIGPNFTDQPVSHSVTVQATDTNSSTTMELIGDVQVDAQPQFDEAPIVANPSVEPRELPSAGGVVTIEADASDNRGISEALAVVQLADGGSVSVPMEPTSASRFEGTFIAPANTSTVAKRYSIEVLAYDDIGQQGSVDAGHVTVAGQLFPSRGKACGLAKALPPHAQAPDRRVPAPARCPAAISP